MSVRLTPPPDRDFPAGRLQLRKEQLVSHVLTASHPSTRRLPRRVLIATATVVAAAATAAAAYGGYTLTRSATQLESIGCYESVSLSANTAVVPSGGGSPVAACAGVWSSAFPGVEPPAGFAACVLDSGAIGVFPAPAAANPCAKVGLPRLASQRHAQH